MKKITAAFDGLKYSQSTRDYAINLAQKTNAHLLGAFMDDALYNSYKVYELIVKSGVSPDRLTDFEERDRKKRSEAAADFESTCKQQAVPYTIHHDRNFAIQEIKHESIYSDLMVIDSAETLSHEVDGKPTRFIKELLADTECPVMVVPSTYVPIEKLILLYDGEPSSVYAIKMFSYLLPELKKLPTEVLTVEEDHSVSLLPDGRIMKEFMKAHFPNATYSIKTGFADEEILAHLQLQDTNTLVVLGAYRRSAMSRWFRESMADVLMRDTKLPLFIAHNRHG